MTSLTLCSNREGSQFQTEARASLPSSLLSIVAFFPLSVDVCLSINILPEIWSLLFVSRMSTLTLFIWECFSPSGQKEMQLESFCRSYFTEKNPSCSFKNLF